jgi:hypothetical protein
VYHKKPQKELWSAIKNKRKRAFFPLVLSETRTQDGYSEDEKLTASSALTDPRSCPLLSLHNQAYLFECEEICLQMQELLMPRCIILLGNAMF